MPASVSGLVPPLKWHGGKHYLAGRIVALMPRHIHYVEPYAGGLAVLLAKSPEGSSEVINDLDGGLTNFWKVLQDTELFEEFRRLVEAIPFSEVEWHDARLVQGERYLPQNQREMIKNAASFESIAKLPGGFSEQTGSEMRITW